MEDFEKAILDIARMHFDNPEQFHQTVENIWKIDSQAPYAERGNFYHNIAQLLANYSYFSLASKIWHNALRYYDEYGDRSGKMSSNLNLSVVHRHLSDFKQAARYANIALDIAKELNDELAQLKCYTNLGNIYENTAKLKEAMLFHQNALNLTKKLQIKDSEAKCFGNIAILYMKLGNYGKSIEFCRHALEISESFGDKISIVRLYANLASCYELMGDVSNMMKYFNKILPLSQELGDKELESGCYRKLADFHYHLRNKTESLKYLNKGLLISKEIKDIGLESRYYYDLATIFLNEHQIVDATKYFIKALDITQKTQDLLLEANIFSDMSLLYKKTDPEKSFEFANKSLDIAKKTNSLIIEKTARIALAQYYENEDLVEAHAQYKRIIDIIEAMGEEIIGQNQLINYERTKSHIFQQFISLCVRLGKKIEAFEYVEKSKSKAFIDLLSTSEIKPSVPITNELKSLLEKESNYLLKIHQVKLDHTIKHDSQYVINELQKIQQELKQIHMKIKKIDSNYVNLRNGTSLSLSEIQSRISEQSNLTIIEYFVSNDKIFIFVINNNKFELKEVNILKKDLQSCVLNFQNRLNYTGIKEDKDSWKDLKKYLIDPVSEYLVKGRTIYFIPHDFLHHIPFHVFDLDGDRIIKHNKIAYLPSSSLIQFFYPTNKKTLKTCSSFGIDFVDESKEIAKIFGSDCFQESTKDTVLKNLHNDILHFSCHGFFDKKDPLSSGIKLNDSLLIAKEIFNLKTNAELVTISACETGLNEIAPGDEMVGFTRAFFYAGAKSVVVSLWKVNGDSTKELMIEFYKNLKKGIDKVTALQQAQITIMENHNHPEWKHPYYWAPFILVGSST